MWYPKQNSRCFASSNKARQTAKAGRAAAGIVWLAAMVFSHGGLAQTGPRSIVPAGSQPNTASGPAPGTRVTPDTQPGSAFGTRVTPDMAPDMAPVPASPAIAGNDSQPPQLGTIPGDPGDPGASGAPGAGILGTLPASLADDTVKQNRLGVIAPANPMTRDGQTLIKLFNTIKGPMPSPELQVIAQGYLLDKGFQELAAPVGLARAEALYRMGFIEDSAGAVVARESTSVAQRAATARMLLALGQRRLACERANVSGFPKGASEGPTFELLRILGFCKLVDGNAKAAKLITGLLREQGGADRLYIELMRAKPRESRVRRAKIRRLRPVHVALFARAGMPVPVRFVAIADPALLARMARNARLIETRIAAAERAVTLGLLGIRELEKLYGEIDPNGADPAALIKQFAKKKAPAKRVVGRAQMLGLMIDGTDQDRVALARAAFADARRAGITRAVVEFIGEELAGIENPEGFDRRDIGTAIEILTMADRPEAAFSWLDAGELGDATTGRATLRPAGIYRGRSLIMMLAPNMGLEFGIDIGATKFSKRDRAFIRTQVALLAALGDAVLPAVTKIAGRVPGVPDLGNISGPVAMLEILAPFSGRSYGKIPLAQLVRGLGALRAMGLDADARRVAVDALIARR